MLKEMLRSARKAAGKTQKEVADHLGVTESTYCGYETGKRKPDALKIRKIAAFLNVSGDYLLETGFDLDEADGKSERNSYSLDEKYLISMYRQLNHEGQRFIADTIEGLIVAGKYSKKDNAVGML